MRLLISVPESDLFFLTLKPDSEFDYYLSTYPNATSSFSQSEQILQPMKASFSQSEQIFLRSHIKILISVPEPDLFFLTIKPNSEFDYYLGTCPNATSSFSQSEQVLQPMKASFSQSEQIFLRCHITIFISVPEPDLFFLTIKPDSEFDYYLGSNPNAISKERVVARLDQLAGHIRTQLDDQLISQSGAGLVEAGAQLDWVTVYPTLGGEGNKKGYK